DLPLAGIVPVLVLLPLHVGVFLGVHVKGTGRLCAPPEPVHTAYHDRLSPFLRAFFPPSLRPRRLPGRGRAFPGRGTVPAPGRPDRDPPAGLVRLEGPVGVDPLEP